MKKLGVIAIVLLCLKLSSQQNRVPPGVPPQQYAQQHQGHPPPPQHMQQHQQVPIHQQVPVQHQVPMHQQVPIQHQVPMHQQQQVPVHQQQQVPVHQQQQVPMHPQQVVPVQHHPQVPVQTPPQQQYQGQPVEQPHHIAHDPHLAGQQLLNMAHMNQEKDHIKEHLEVPLDTSNMSEQELQFHYFKMHDADNNNKLDGCELIKSLIHWHEQGHHHDPATASQLPPDQRGSKLFADQELVSLIDPILTMDDTNRDGFIDYPEFVQAQHKAAATTQVKA